ncbi:hypothetical protein JCM19047_1367 [Bacillus sp. JCM 19047]|nr:hypothetical protein JCM19047_1367 [Bacillus sp. JCM 19047]
MVKGIGQPNDIALSDRFTSSFLQEDIKTDEGFHFFESQNGHYSMWYPEGFYLQDEPPSYISKDHYELLNLYEDGTDSNGIERHIQVRYESGMSSNLVETNLNLLLKDTAYNDEYIELDHQGNKIFYGSSYQIIDGKNVHTLPSQDHDANRYFALVVNQDKTKHISVYHRLNCIDESRGSCKIDDVIERSFFETFINHIEFR